MLGSDVTSLPQTSHCELLGNSDGVLRQIGLGQLRGIASDDRHQFGEVDPIIRGRDEQLFLKRGGHDDVLPNVKDELRPRLARSVRSTIRDRRGRWL